jgi:hypothetical protein
MVAESLTTGRAVAELGPGEMAGVHNGTMQGSANPEDYRAAWGFRRLYAP